MDVGTTNPLVRRLAHARRLTHEDCSALHALCARKRHVEAGQDIIRHGEPPHDVHIVLDGFAYHYKLMPNGGRQITRVLLPGDFCDLHVAILGRMDHSVGAFTPCTVTPVCETDLLELTGKHPNLALALWWAALVDEAVLREWLANVGRRDAVQRLSHFFCEMLVRMQLVGLADGNSYALPFRQADLADILGLTSVHVNRTLQELRSTDLIVLKSRQVTILDVPRLKDLCGFDPTYLHLDEMPGHTTSDRRG